jgi:hypothetical protein
MKLGRDWLTRGSSSLRWLGLLGETPECAGCSPRHEAKAVRMQNMIRPGRPRKEFGTRRVPNSSATPNDPRKKNKAKPNNQRDEL